MPNGISHDATKMEQELYRAGTRINVTLKYTRTGAVIQSLIEQLCITFKFGIDELIMHAKEPLYLPYDEKMKLLKEKYPGIFDAYFALYAELAQLGACKEAINVDEYRRTAHVIFNVGDKKITVGIDAVTAYYDRTKEFCTLVLRHVGKEH